MTGTHPAAEEKQDEQGETLSVHSGLFAEQAKIFAEQAKINREAEARAKRRSNEVAPPPSAATPPSLAPSASCPRPPQPLPPQIPTRSTFRRPSC